MFLDQNRVKELLHVQACSFSSLLVPLVLSAVQFLPALSQIQGSVYYVRGIKLIKIYVRIFLSSVWTYNYCLLCH